MSPAKRDPDTLASIMTREVVKVRGDEPLVEVRKLLRRRGFHHVLVVEDDRVLGVVSDRDILRTLSPFLDTIVEQPRDVGTLGIRAREIMSRTIVTARPDTTLSEAVGLLVGHGISCLPIVGDGGALLGIVTTKDILRRIAELTEP